MQNIPGTKNLAAAIAGVDVALAAAIAGRDGIFAGHARKVRADKAALVPKVSAGLVRAEVVGSKAVNVAVAVAAVFVDVMIAVEGSVDARSVANCLRFRRLT
jgi:hypothetical protein